LGTVFLLNLSRLPEPPAKEADAEAVSTGFQMDETPTDGDPLQALLGLSSCYLLNLNLKLN
jgi:hypothetical protein